MILKELCDYYDILSGDSNIEIARAGYSSAKISYAIVLNDDGSISGIMDLRNEAESGKKLLPRILMVPERLPRSGKNPPPYFLSDKTEYLADASKFQEFKKYNASILHDINSANANVVRNFLNKGILADIELPEGNFVLMNKDYKYIHEDERIKNVWENIKESSVGTEGQCLISGEKAVMARLHPKIKGVRGAQSAGANLISFQADSGYDSYGKTQGLNAPVSERVAFKYGTVLNHMLQNQTQKTLLGDSTVVFWAQHPSPKYSDTFLEFINPSAKFDSNKNDDEKEQDEKRERLIKDILNKVNAGIKPVVDGEELNNDTKFCVLALAPNNARLSVRFFYQDSFGSLIKKIGRHYEDMEIVDARAEQVPVWLLAKETVHEKSTPSPLLAGRILTSIISGSAYPSSLLTAIVKRVYAGQNINAVKAGIIKACLIRKYKNKKGVFTVSLNKELKEPAYMLGRLFAVLEQAQWKALGDVNSGIRERFFASAASSPARVFPQLLKNTQNHLAKMDNSIWLDKQIGEIMADIECFPLRLNMDEQGIFMLGYYHQRQALFTKKETQETKEI